MALELWMAQQDRSGIEESPTFAVPAGRASARAEVASAGFVSPAQRLTLEFHASFNGGVSYEPYGSTLYDGGELGVGKDGLPLRRTLEVGFNAERYPTHMFMRTNAVGVINCGVSVEFRPADA